MAPENWGQLDGVPGLGSVYAKALGVWAAVLRDQSIPPREEYHRLSTFAVSAGGAPPQMSPPRDVYWPASWSLGV
jgi:hypothetical protein